MHRAELLVPGHQLDPPGPGLHEEDEVADDVEEMRGAEHPSGEGLLARQGLLAERRRNLGGRDGARLLPLPVVLVARAHTPEHRLQPRGADHELVVVEEPLDALVLVDPIALVRVAEELRDRLFDRIGHTRADRKSTRLNSSHVAISYA